MSLNNVIKSIIAANAPAGGSAELAYTEILYVSPNGDNSDGSSWTKAYNTIQSAITAASADLNDYTLILVADGSYTIAAQITITKHIEIRGMSRDGVIIDCQVDDAVPPVECNIRIQANNVSIKNCSFVATAAINISAMIAIESYKGTLIENCFFNNEAATAAFAILCEGSALGEVTLSINTIILNCEFEDHTTYPIYGGAYTYIINCNFHGSAEGLIKLDATATFTYIYGCVFSDWGSGYSAISLAGAFVGPLFIDACLIEQSYRSYDLFAQNGSAAPVTIRDCDFRYKIQQLPTPNNEVTLTDGGAAYTDGVAVEVLGAGVFEVHKIKQLIAQNPSGPDTFFFTGTLDDGVNPAKTIFQNVPIVLGAGGTGVYNLDLPFFNLERSLKVAVKTITGAALTVDVSFMVESLRS